MIEEKLFIIIMGPFPIIIMIIDSVAIMAQAIWLQVELLIRLEREPRYRAAARYNASDVVKSVRVRKDEC